MIECKFIKNLVDLLTRRLVVLKINRIFVK